MNRIQLSQQSLTRQSQYHNDDLLTNININMKRSRQRQKQQNISKQNDSKHVNAIRPYVGYNKQRKISKRQSQKNIPALSPYQSNNISGCMNICENIHKQKNKKSEVLVKKMQQSLNIRNINEIYFQFITIKNQYRQLKNLYNNIIKQNIHLNQRKQQQQTNLKQLKKQVERYKRDDEQNKKNIKFIQQQIERIKKQCIRMVETQKFKNKKLQETLQQKQLMIAYLRNQLSIFNGDSNHGNNNFFFQHTAPSFIRNISNSGILSQDTTTYNTNINLQKHANFQLQKEGQLQKNSINIKNFINNSCTSNVVHGQSQFNNINIPNIPYIAKSIFNNSGLNNSSVVGSEVIDLPRQVNNHKNKKKDIITFNDENKKYVVNSEIKNIQQIDNYKKIGINKKQCMIINQDDSLSFSYDKSKQSINQQDYDSVHSFNDPTILTFTKKDIYILEQDQHNSNINKNNSNQQIKQKKSSIVMIDKNQDNFHFQDKKYCKGDKIDSLYQSDFQQQQQNINADIREERNQQKSNYTGEQQLLTFENRVFDKKTQQNLYKMINPSTKLKQNKKDQKNLKQKRKQRIPLKQILNDEKKQISSKSKLHTKRIQGYIDEIGNLGQGKQYSAQTKKRSINHDNIHPKTGKKKIGRKRKSQEFVNNLVKK